MNMPRIRLLKQEEPWLARVALASYPLPGVGVMADIYDCIDGGYIVIPIMADHK